MINTYWLPRPCAVEAWARRLVLLLSVAAVGYSPAALAQDTPPPAAAADSLHKFENPAAQPKPHRPWYRSKLVRAVAVPAVLIGYGASTIYDHGFYSSYDARNDLRRAFPGFRRTYVDDYLIYAPYLELGAVALAGVESRSDRINTLLVIAKSEVIMGVLVTGLKYGVGIRRPDTGMRNSFPSGHTAQAFLAASIVHTEFRDRSQWYGVGAYTIATSVAAFRMLNDRHWESDVFAGAGIGILSAHLGYLTHRNRWGRKPRERAADMSVVPLWSPAGGAGLALSWQLK